jgi:thiol-disulfide isomerase/thioredoxin
MQPNTILPHTVELQTRLAEPLNLLVACYCAAWCDTCTLYRDRFDALAKQHPEHAFVWIDIESHPELLGDEDVEDFPTLLIERDGQVLFFGTMLPHIQQLERLMVTLSEDPNAAPVDTQLPDVRRALASA